MASNHEVVGSNPTGRDNFFNRFKIHRAAP